MRDRLTAAAPNAGGAAARASLDVAVRNAFAFLETRLDAAIDH